MYNGLAFRKGEREKRKKYIKENASNWTSTVYMFVTRGTGDEFTTSKLVHSRLLFFYFALFMHAGVIFLC